ncbi:MAG: hypothetical protein RPR40_00565 [Bermanella sp.]
MEDIVEDILKAKDLVVVLENRVGHHYLESYQLSSVLMLGGKFWGKVRHVHPPVGNDDVYYSQPLSYAYSNFCDVVCSMSMGMNTRRYSSAFNYSRLDFLCKGSFKEIWNDSGCWDTSYLQQAVSSGMKLKVIIKSSSDLYLILPVHTLEVYQGMQKFALDTEFDGVPNILLDFNEMCVVDEKLKNTVKNLCMVDNISTQYIKNTSFFLLSFVVTSHSVEKRYIDEQGRIVTRSYPYQSVQIYSEVATLFS